MAEEVGVEVGEVDYFGNQPWPLPASLMLGFVGRARSRGTWTSTARRSRRRGGSPATELRAGIEAGEVLIPRSVSISSSLIEHWYGGPLPGGW